MNKERHMIMQACEEILANQGRMTGIDESLLDNLQFAIDVHLRERDVRLTVDTAMGRFDEVMRGLRDAF